MCPAVRQNTSNEGLPNLEARGKSGRPIHEVPRKGYIGRWKALGWPDPTQLDPTMNHQFSFLSEVS